MVFIRTIDSKTLTFELNPKTTTVHTLKLEIEHKLHKSLLHQRLILPPSRLLSNDDDSVAISQLGVGRNSTLILHVPFFGGMQAPILPKSRLEFLNTKPPPNYVAGLGRGATGFITWFDIGTARAAPNLSDRSATIIGGAAAGPSGAVWMSHGDEVAKLPNGFEVVARSQQGAVAAVENTARRFYGLQYHPEKVIWFDPHIKAYFAY